MIAAPHPVLAEAQQLEIRVDDERASRGWEVDIDPDQGPKGPVLRKDEVIGAAGYSVEFDENDKVVRIMEDQGGS